jgi:hypothetical protein
MSHRTTLPLAPAALRRRACLAAVPRSRQAAADEVTSSSGPVHTAAIKLASWIPSCCARVAVLMAKVPTPAALEASASTAMSPPPQAPPGSDPKWKTTVAHTTNARVHAQCTAEQKDSAPLLEDRRRRIDCTWRDDAEKGARRTNLLLVS